MDCYRTDPHQNVPGLQAGIDTRRSISKTLNHHIGVVFRFVRLNDVHSDPAWSDFSKADEIGPDLFRSFHGKRIAGRPIVDRKNQYTDDFTLQIEDGSARFASLGRNVGPNQSGAEILVQIFEIKTADHSKCRRDREIHWVTDRYDR